MADATGSIFTKKATEKLRNPDDLERYIKVTKPSVWVVLGACIALLVGLLSWGIFGSLSTNVSTSGCVVEGRAMCFLPVDSVGKVHEGDIANLGGQTMTVSSIAPLPLSRDEAREMLGSDYLAAAMLADDWAYEVDLRGDTSELPERVPQQTSITVERVSPITLLMQGWS